MQMRDEHYSMYLIGVNMSVGFKQRSLPAGWVLGICLTLKTSE